MIIGIGTDITDLSRIHAAYEKFGRRFLQKTLTHAEQALLPSSPVAFIAGRFAAKEAAVKALGTGFSRNIFFQHIEVLRGPQGQPRLYLTGPALEHARNLGMQTAHISISHDRNAAIAVVVLEA